MALPDRQEPAWRTELQLTSDRNFSDEIGHFGRAVGPRKGEDKRTKAEKESFCLRRLLIALRRQHRIAYPLTVLSADEAPSQPDFWLLLPDGSGKGIEVTEATAEDYQQELTRTERSGEQDETLVAFDLESEDGFVVSALLREAASLVQDAIERKLGKPYVINGSTELLVYLSLRGGLGLDQEIDRLLSALNEYLESRQSQAPLLTVHLLIGETLVMNLGRNDQAVEDLSADYDIDFDRWTLAQARALSQRQDADLDRDNLAEEIESLGKSDRRALGSHLRTLMLHLLKLQHQRNHPTGSWKQSISNARSEIDDYLADSPSLAAEAVLEKLIAEQYPRARKSAALETGLPLATFPEAGPYTLEQLLDDDFLPLDD